MLPITLHHCFLHMIMTAMFNPRDDAPHWKWMRELHHYLLHNKPCNKWFNAVITILHNSTGFWCQRGKPSIQRTLCECPSTNTVVIVNSENATTMMEVRNQMIQSLEISYSKTAWQFEQGGQLHYGSQLNMTVPSSMHSISLLLFASRTRALEYESFNAHIFDLVSEYNQ